jgi:hypothetical protein
MWKYKGDVIIKVKVRAEIINVGKINTNGVER